MGTKELLTAMKRKGSAQQEQETARREKQTWSSRKTLSETQLHPGHSCSYVLSIKSPLGYFKLNFYHLYLKYFWPIHYFSPLNPLTQSFPAFNYCQLKFYLPWDSQFTFCEKANKRIQIQCHNDKPQVYVQSISLNCYFVALKITQNKRPSVEMFSYSK